jgi:stress response protein YsnF
VPKETVRLSKVENTDEREVDAEVRKEQVDVDDGS